MFDHCVEYISKTCHKVLFITMLNIKCHNSAYITAVLSNIALRMLGHPHKTINVTVSVNGMGDEGEKINTC